MSETLYCPRPRAENAGPGECCHHPLRGIREKLEVMRAAGVKVTRWGRRVRDPNFVARLYEAFKRAKGTCGTASPGGSG